MRGAPSSMMVAMGTSTRLVFVLALATGCSSSAASNTPSSSATVTGSVVGIAIPSAVAQTEYGESTNESTGTKYATLFVSVASRHPECALVPADVSRALKNVDQLNMVVSTEGKTLRPVGPAAYAITPKGPDAAGNYVSATIVRINEKCSGDEVKNKRATAGSITVESVTDAKVVGKFALEFDTGEKLTGTFDSPRCARAKDTSSPVCE